MSLHKANVLLSELTVGVTALDWYIRHDNLLGAVVPSVSLPYKLLHWLTFNKGSGLSCVGLALMWDAHHVFAGVPHVPHK